MTITTFNVSSLSNCCETTTKRKWVSAPFGTLCMKLSFMTDKWLICSIKDKSNQKSLF